MKKLILLQLFMIMIFSNAFSQIKNDSLGWHVHGFTGINVSQVAVSNWVAGGDNSYAGSGLFHTTAKYIRSKTYWDNSLELAYGLIKIEGQGVRKNDDRISFTSNYGRYAFGKFYYSALLTFNTQFAPGYNYPNDTVVVSRFMAPGYLTLGIGLNWKPVDYFSLFVSPATGKLTFVMDQKLADVGAYGVDSATHDANGFKNKDGQEIKPEFGASLNAQFGKEIFKNIGLASVLNLFCDYTDKVTSKRANIVVDWQTGLLMKVNEYVNVSISTEVIYNDKIPVPLYETINGVKTQVGTGPRTQFREVLAIGFGYKF